LLRGVPIAVKDLYDTAGVRTTAASAHFADRVPGEDAAVVRSLREAGAVLVGKLNMDEFAYNFTSETSHFGPVQNPWKPGYSPGGSSGGSAAAVAAGLCYAALGSDTGGSIRLPAALCGIVGFKPTFGRLPVEGVLPLAWSLDHVGPMCRTVGDCRMMLEAMGMKAGRQPRFDRRIRLGIPLTPYWEKLDAETETLVRRAVEMLGGQCGGSREVTLPAIGRGTDSAAFPHAYSTVIFAEAYAYHRERTRSRPEAFHAGTLRTILLGEKIPAADYIAARRELDRLRATSRDLFREADLLVMPTAPGPAFRLGSPPDLVFLRNTAPWNLYGLPAVSVPCGVTKGGLPVGLQIVGPAGGDDLVLAAAGVVEEFRLMPASSVPFG
jgi:aspartyl-tRNA(Asn)/glutamyl-tRNA(Gln) amidotransferase subunit A